MLIGLGLGLCWFLMFWMGLVFGVDIGGVLVRFNAPGGF